MNRQALARTFIKIVERLGLDSVEGIVLGKDASRTMLQLNDGTKEITLHVKPKVFDMIQREQVTATPVTRQKGEEILYFQDAKFINKWPGDEKVVVIQVRGDIPILTVSAMQ